MAVVERRNDVEPLIKRSAERNGEGENASSSFWRLIRTYSDEQADFQLVSSIRKLGAPWWWCLTFLCGALGGLSSISILAWLQPVCLLQFLHSARFNSQPGWSQGVVGLQGLAAGGLGYWVSHASMLSNRQWDAMGVFLVFLVCMGGWGILIFAFMADFLFRKKYPLAQHFQPLVFPLTWTAAWYFAALHFPSGSIGNPAYTQTGVRPLILCASLFGTEGITFLMAWTASVLHRHLALREEPGIGGVGPRADRVSPRGLPGSAGVPAEARRLEQAAKAATSFHGQLLGLLLFLCLLFGGTWEGLLSGVFFQRSLSEVIKPTVPASCISDQLAVGARLERLLNTTRERLLAGDQIVLWSETAAYVKGDSEETALLERLRQLAATWSDEGGPARDARSAPKDEGVDKKKHRWQGSKRSRQQWWEAGDGTVNKFTLGGPYVAATYQKLLDGHKEGAYGSAYNRLVIASPRGIELEYSKANPAMFVEKDVVPGNATAPPMILTPSGIKIAAAICADFDFPGFMRGAGRQGADIVLQAVETWGPVGAYEAETNAVRAVENGFLQFRCASNGVSSVVDSAKRFRAYVPTMEEGMATFKIPIMRRARTFYPVAGFLFGPLVLFMACMVFGLAFSKLSPQRTSPSE